MAEDELQPDEEAANSSLPTTRTSKLSTDIDQVAIFASQAENLQSVRESVDNAAKVGSTLWTSYIAILFYILITVGGVTHEQLFLGRPIKVPLFDVDLPIKSFFWIAPAIFLIVHSYVLLHIVMLAEKFGYSIRNFVDRWTRRGLIPPCACACACAGNCRAMSLSNFWQVLVRCGVAL